MEYKHITFYKGEILCWLPAELKSKSKVSDETKAYIFQKAKKYGLASGLDELKKGYYFAPLFSSVSSLYFFDLIYIVISCIPHIKA